MCARASCSGVVVRSCDCSWVGRIRRGAALMAAARGLTHDNNEGCKGAETGTWDPAA